MCCYSCCGLSHSLFWASSCHRNQLKVRVQYRLAFCCIIQYFGPPEWCQTPADIKPKRLPRASWNGGMFYIRMLPPLWMECRPTMGPTSPLKSNQHRSKVNLDVKKDLEGHLVPLGNDFRPSGGRFGSPGNDFRASRDRISTAPGDAFPHVYFPGCLPPLLLCRPRFHVSAGTRVSVYNLLFSLISINRSATRDDEATCEEVQGAEIPREIAPATFGAAAPPK